jgi:hypothetical protein
MRMALSKLIKRSTETIMIPRYEYDIGTAQNLRDLIVNGGIGLPDMKYLLTGVPVGVVQARPVGGHGRAFPARFIAFELDAQDLRAEFGKHSRRQRPITISEVDNPVTIKKRDHSQRRVAVRPFTLS